MTTETEEDLDETMTIGAGTLVDPLRLPGEQRTAPSLSALPRVDLGSEGSELETLGVLAEGGMGRVLHARQHALGRDVAIKTAKHGASADEIDCLLREAFVSGALEHPSIVPIYALGVSADGQPLLVMRKVEGVTWSKLIGDPSHPAWATHLGSNVDALDANIDILIAITRALEFAHLRGVIHRDVKPCNVMLGRFGEVYLVDWGLAVESGHLPDGVAGTPGYMAPEMANGETVDERTDVYLLGATLHRFLTGRPRHRGGTVTDAVEHARASAPALYGPDVAPPLAELCNAACAANKSERPASARAFRDALVAFKRNRSSNAICQQANARLTRLDHLLEEAGTEAPSDLRLAYRLVTEARFGFAHALDQQPAHAEAKAGEARCVEHLIELELRQGHVDTAAALLDELPEGSPALELRIDAARAAQRTVAAENARLRAIDRDLDPVVGSRALVILSAGLITMAVTATLSIALMPEAAARARRDVLLPALGALPLVVIAVASVVARKKLFANTWNLRVVATVALTALACFIQRLFAVHRGLELAPLFTDELVIVALAASASAITLTRRFAAAVPVLLAGALVIELSPKLAIPAYPITIVCSFAVLAGVVWRQRRS